MDIVSELIEADEFDSMVPEKARKPIPEFEAKELLAQHKVLVLMEGTTDNPTNPESKDLVALLHRHGVKFVALDLV